MMEIKKTLFSILVISLVVMGVSSWSFLSLPQPVILGDGELYTSFTAPMIKLGMLGLIDVGFQNSKCFPGCILQFQLFKNPEVSLGYEGLTVNTGSYFAVGGLDFNSIKMNGGIAYGRYTPSTETVLFFASLKIPVSFGEVLLEYERNFSLASNSTALGIGRTFQAGESFKWLFDSLTVAAGIGWEFTDSNFGVSPNSIHLVVDTVRYLK